MDSGDTFGGRERIGRKKAEGERTDIARHGCTYDVGVNVGQRMALAVLLGQL